MPHIGMDMQFCTTVTLDADIDVHAWCYTHCKLINEGNVGKVSPTPGTSAEVWGRGVSRFHQTQTPQLNSRLPQHSTSPGRLLRTEELNEGEKESATRDIQPLEVRAQ
jgi:hypothetical protein